MRLALLAVALGPACEAQFDRGHAVWDPAATRTPPPPDADEGEPEDPGGDETGGAGGGGLGGAGGGGERLDAGTSGDHPDARRSGTGGAGGGGGTDAGGTDVISAPAACHLTFTVTTVTFKGDYAPDNIGAIWIADANDKFVKTLKVWANKRRTYLETWKKASGSNVVDAVTGATAGSHAARNVTWNCTDVKGQIVPDGIYRVRAQFTEEETDGKLMTPIAFTKDGTPVDLMPPAQTYFKLIHLQVGP